MNKIVCKLTGEIVNNYNDYLLTEHWKRKKYALSRQSKKICPICGATENLDVHHITYKRLGDEKMSDLMYICRH